MIIPHYVQAVDKAIFPEEIIGKWYCFYHEERENMTFSRYLHPTGWYKTSHWWNSKEEAEAVFNVIGQQRLLVTEREVELEREHWREFRREQLNW